MEDEINFSLKEMGLLQKMLYFKQNKRFAVHELSFFLLKNHTNPNFRKVFNYLKNVEIIKEIEKIGPTKFLSLDYKKLKKLISKQEITNKWRDMFVDHYVSSINYI